MLSESFKPDLDELSQLTLAALLTGMRDKTTPPTASFVAQAIKFLEVHSQPRANLEAVRMREVERRTDAMGVPLDKNTTSSGFALPTFEDEEP